MTIATLNADMTMIDGTGGLLVLAPGEVEAIVSWATIAAVSGPSQATASFADPVAIESLLVAAGMVLSGEAGAALGSPASAATGS